MTVAPISRDELLHQIDALVTEVLGYYAEDVFTPATKEDYERMNKMDASLNTRLHCSGIRHGLHQLRRAARDLSARDDLEEIRVPSGASPLPKPKEES